MVVLVPEFWICVEGND
ncbi:unnamed protein product [Rhodiola kirilowii]